MSVCEGMESEEDENRGLCARFRVVRFGLVAVGRRSRLFSCLKSTQTRATSGCRCGDLAMELERLRVVALGGHSESIFRAPKRRKAERLVTLTVVTSLPAGSLWDVALKSTQPERPRGVAVVRRSQIDTTRATSGCRCADLALELEQLHVVALGGRSESIFRALKRRKAERLVTLAVVTLLPAGANFHPRSHA
ncbi:hypothetical protein F2Q69_00027259 [Brassica cretica]|uniref:Uncharacterized protein n=1 Tax=Brassica cretica TaxID=69181 RepID=A0A8S9RQI7_BRACR|nr:hypothetical protein F2Q69_00027259 [Brassica cretica]